MRSNSSIPHDEGLLDASATRDFFSGWIEYRINPWWGRGEWTPNLFASQGRSPNFNNDEAAFERLIDHHTRFFVDNVFACTVGLNVTSPNDPHLFGLPLYNSTVEHFGSFTMRDVHANMNIGPAAFSAFIARIIFVAR